jgi:hypothetical protein
MSDLIKMEQAFNDEVQRALDAAKILLSNYSELTNLQ